MKIKFQDSLVQTRSDLLSGKLFILQPEYFRPGTLCSESADLDINLIMVAMFQIELLSF